MLRNSSGSNVYLHRRNEASLTLTAAESRSISVRCTGSTKSKLRTPLVSHLLKVSSLLDNALLKKAHLLLFIYNRSRLRRINFLSTECQQRLKTRTSVTTPLLEQYSITLALRRYSVTTPLLCHYSITLSLLHYPVTTPSPCH